MKSDHSPLAIGLTGGIAAGKSTVSEMLARKGAHIIDADKVGHQVISPEGEAYPDIIIAFGTGILDKDGSISRKFLGKLVFSDPDALQRLNSLAHPAMERRMADNIHAIRAREKAQRPPLIVLDAAILFEAKWNPLCDKTWAVHVSPERAVKRLVERNQMTKKEALARLNAQMNNAERERLVDTIINNEGSLEALELAINMLWDEVVAR